MHALLPSFDGPRRVSSPWLTRRSHPAHAGAFRSWHSVVPRPNPAGARSSGRDAAELRDDLLAVTSERLLLALRHQIDVELVDADRLELLQLVGRLLGRPQHAEAVADLVGDELAVLRADAAVLLVVVELPRLHVVGQRGRDLRL